MSAADPGRGVPQVPGLLTGRRRWIFAALVAVGLGLAVAAVLWSVLVARVITALSAPAGAVPGAGGPLGGVQWLVALAVVSGVLLYTEKVLAERLGQAWVSEVRTVLFRRVTDAPSRGTGRGRSTGGTSLRMMGDLSALRRWASLGLAKLAVAVPLLVGCLVAFAVIAPVLALAAAAVMGAGLATAAALSPWLRSANRAARRRQARVASHVVERVGNTQVVQAFGRERGERRVLARRGRRLAEASVRRARAVGTVRAIAESTALLTTAAVLIATAASGAGPAQAAAAIAVVGIMATPVRELARVAEYRSACSVSLEQIRAELARPGRNGAASGAPALPDGGGALELRGVAFTGLLTPTTVGVPAGAVVAVVGPNGSGKSTLLAAVSGLVGPDEGEVLLDGADIARARPASVRAAIGSVGPHLPLLRGTIGENVRYADPKADGMRLNEAVHASGLAELIAELPLGLRTPVRENGAGLSAGQQQRIALARALLTRPRLLLLDEADAHLDPAAAAVVDRVIAGFDGTVVVVTHRPERLAAADVVWRLGNGVLRVEEAPRAAEAAARTRLEA
ncbi:ATP-binding cassette subfamily B protein [Murinocardiopsis flavida]|uniref:ATP-binding cassette subfamily B protein n=1 Tax=Murinocardiopsis flavida TaxID=645275 RepID=A0A2P8DQJ1_9ACTN|nr:ABC transporter ATP-binding protein [Murinocardiopsis flavida]PSK99462.1 ATP-binding cassette subfamily B protein [Murinocardiopsis flavida]